jgi:hypothetical protein
MFHAIRNPDGTWVGFGNVKGQAGDPGSFLSIGTALIAVAPIIEVSGPGIDGLHVLGSTQ